MRLARLGPAGSEVPVVHHRDGFLDLRPLTDDLDGAFFADGGVDRIRAAVTDDALPEYRARDGERVGAPIARPQAVICVGLNYAAHAAESGAELPRHPVIFFKHPNTVVGPYDRVAIPRRSTRTDWEVELGLVVGRRASYLGSRDEARDAIAGYVAVNDLSERTFQLDESGGQWSKGKSAAGFTPTGPWLTTPNEFDPSDARLRSFVNGEPRQDSTTADMIFDPAEIVRDLSQYLVLEPGDLVLTGTPEGVALSGRFAYLTAGDVVEIEIDGLGRQRQEFTDA